MSRYALHRARGKCTSCGKRAHGFAYCQRCRADMKENAQVLRSAGLCVEPCCSNVAGGGFSRCEACRQRRTMRQAARRKIVRIFHSKEAA